jgi:Fe-S oxidoreductase
MATYRAEFLSHYYENISLPFHAHAFGRIDRWARFASIWPAAVNFINASRPVRPILNKLLGLAAQRQLPQFASENFHHWLSRRGGSSTGNQTPKSDSRATPNNKEVLLWVDTFNNHFHPETSRAALHVLEDAGFQVTTSQKHLCCGRPLYDFGMLDEAKKYLQRILQALRPQIEAGLPMVVLEPSCASVFRDELVNLFPKDDLARRLHAQTFLLSEFLQRSAPDYQPPQLSQKILLHGHCHHRALMKMTDEEALLRKTGAEITSPDAGCCGMAGAFGFEKDKFEISQAIGERVLLPAVRALAADTIIVSDGFSCREQITHFTGRKPIHLAEALQLARVKPSV